MDDFRHYWAQIAADVAGKSDEECRARWIDATCTVKSLTAADGKVCARKGQTTQEIAATYAANGITKRHAHTAHFASNMSRIVAAAAERDTLAYEPAPVSGYSPATPIHIAAHDGDDTPGTEARERRRGIEMQLPEIPAIVGAATTNADRVVAAFPRRFGNLLSHGAGSASTAAASPKQAPDGGQRRHTEQALEIRARARDAIRDDNLLT